MLLIELFYTYSILYNVPRIMVNKEISSLQIFVIVFHSRLLAISLVKKVADTSVLFLFFITRHRLLNLIFNCRNKSHVSNTIEKDTRTV